MSYAGPRIGVRADEADVKKFYLKIPDGSVIDFLIDEKNDFCQIWYIGPKGDIEDTQCVHFQEARTIFKHIKDNHGGQELN